MTPPAPTVDELRGRARAKLTAGELRALTGELRRELQAELASKAARAPRVRELPEVASGARRMIRAVGQRAAADVEGLAELAQLRDEVDTQLRSAVHAARAGEGLSNGGYSWADVARVLGCTRQAAQQRFGA